MAISPRINQLSQPASQEDEQALFEQGFSTSAQSMLTNKVPDLADKIVLFKMIHSDIDTGSAVGAFILQVGPSQIYVPCILMSNELKPMEIMYVKDAGMFLPLSTDWVGEVEKEQLDSLGEGVKRPQTLSSDVDITRLTRPPVQGRYVYASLNESSREALLLPGMLTKVDNLARAKFANVLKDHPALLKTAAAIYGPEVLLKALQPTRVKQAAAPAPRVEVATRATPAAQVKRIFGAQSGAAMRKIASDGVAVSDKRESTNRPVDTETTVKIEDIQKSGPVTLLSTKGDLVKTLVVSDPIDICYGDSLKSESHATAKNVRKVVNQTWRNTRNHDADSSSYSGIGSDYGTPRLLLTETGSCSISRRSLVGKPLGDGDIASVDRFKALYADTPAKAPRPGQYGVFIRREGMGLSASEPVFILSVSEDADKVRRVLYTDHKPYRSENSPYTAKDLEADKANAFVGLTDPKTPIHKFQVVPQSKIRYIPKDYSFVECDEKRYSYSGDDEFVRDPSAINGKLLSFLFKFSKDAVSIVKKAEVFYTTGDNVGRDKVATLLKLILAYDVNESDAKEMLKTASEKGVARYLLVKPSEMIKMAAAQAVSQLGNPAQMQAMDPSMQAGGVPQQGGAAPTDPAAMQQMGGDPTAMQQGDPAAMQQGDPAAMQAQQVGQQPSALDIAIQDVQEKVEQLHQMQEQALLQQKQNLEMQLQALQAVQMRTSEVEQGVPKEQSQALALTEQAPDPSADQPDAGSSAAQQGQAMPQAPGMAGQGPAMPGQSVDSMNQAIDPAAMQQAADMQDPSMFDTAAIASLAESSTLTDAVVSYLPAMMKSLDNIGRILTTFWMKGTDLQNELGNERYHTLEDKLRNIFKGMGDLLLNVHQNALIVRKGTDTTYENATS